MVGCFPQKTPSKPNPKTPTKKGIKNVQKTKFSLDGVVRHNTLRMLFILFTLFSFHFSLLAENISSKEDNAIAIADKYNSIGMTYYGEDDNKALESFEKALKIYLVELGGKVSPFLISTTYNNIGMALHNKGEYDKAIEFYNKAIKIYLVTLGKNDYHTVSTRTYLAHAFNGLASSYRDKQEYQKAIDYYNRALLLHKKIAQTNSIYSDDVLTEIENIIKTHQENNNFQKAKEIYTKALDYYNKLFIKDKKVYGFDYSVKLVGEVEGL